MLVYLLSIRLACCSSGRFEVAGLSTGHIVSLGIVKPRSQIDPWPVFCKPSNSHLYKENDHLNSSHPCTFLGALPARFRTFLTMFVFVLATLVCTFVADVGTTAAQFFCPVTSQAH